MRTVIVFWAFALLPVYGDLWVNYLLGLTSDYLHAAKYAVSCEQAYQIARPVVQRAKGHCVTGKATDIHPIYDDDVLILLKPCGFLSDTLPMLTTVSMYMKKYKIVIQAMADFRFNVSFQYIQLLFSLDECMVESITLIEPDNKENLRICGTIPPGYVHLKYNEFGVVARKHAISNSSFLLFYHLIDHSTVDVQQSLFYPIHSILKMYGRPMNILGDYITCHGCYSTITYIKLMIHEAIQTNRNRT